MASRLPWQRIWRHFLVSMATKIHDIIKWPGAGWIPYAHACVIYHWKENYYSILTMVVGFVISIITSGKSINIYIYIYINYHIFGLFLCECIKCKTHTPYKKADGISFPLMYNTYVCMQYPPCARPFYNTGYFGCHGNKNLAPNLLPWQRGSQNINRGA